MTDEKYSQSKILISKIERIESSIRNIDSLLKSCGLTCTITGTQPGRFTRGRDYITGNKIGIKQILESDRQILISTLDNLKNEFKEI